MPLSIQFQQAKPSSFGGDDIVGRFRSGRQTQGRPQSLQTWRATADDRGVTDAIARLLGGKSAEWETAKNDKWEVITEADSLDITLEYLNVQMVLWGSAPGGKPVRTCDGTVRRDAGSHCECPSDLKERKAAASNGLACKPETQAVFRLAELPDLGKFRYVSGSYGLADTITRLEEALASANGETPATISLKQVEFDTASGEHRKYTLPVIKLLEPALT